VRCFGLGVALQHARPVIEIVDRDEQDIWFSVLLDRVLPFAVGGIWGQSKNIDLIVSMDQMKWGQLKKSQFFSIS
jgi:hypothetical protein